MRTLRRLTRHFLSALVDNDLIAAGEDLHASIAGILAGLIVVSGCVALIFLGKYNSVVASVKGKLTAQYQTLPDKLAMALDDKALLLGGAMILMALVVVIFWDALALDERDLAVLAPLPVRPATVLLAKAAAVTGAAGVVAVALNALPALLFPVVVLLKAPVGPDVVVRAIAAHAAAGLAGCAFVFLALSSVQGVMGLFPQGGLVRRGLPFVQFVLVLALLSMLFALPVAAARTRAAIEAGASGLMLYPPLWFLGLEEVLIGRTEPVFIALARASVVAVGLSVAAACLVHAFAWRLRVHRTSAAAGSPASAAGRVISVSMERLARLLAADGRVRASFLFTARTLTRSPRHRLYLAGSLGLGLAVAGATIAAASAGLGFGREALSLKSMALAAQLNLIFFLVVGIRTAATVPADLEAGWVFRFNVSHARERHIAGTRAAIFFLAVLPLLLVLAPVHAWLWGVYPATVHFAFGVVAALGLLEIVFTDYARMPFVSQFTPGRAVLSPRFGLYVFDYFLFAYATPGIEQLLIERTGFFYAWLGLLAVVVGRFLSSHSARLRRDQMPVFDNPVEMEQLGLWDTVHTRTVPDGQHSIAPEALFQSVGRESAPRVTFREGSRVWPGSQIGADVKYAVRRLRMNSGFTAFSVVSLALGIGATTALYSVIYSTILKPLDVRDLATLVNVYHASPLYGNRPLCTLSLPDFEDFRSSQTVFAGVAAHAPFRQVVIANGVGEKAVGESVSGEYFSVLGIQPAAGRLLQAADDRPGGPRVAVIGERMWRRRFDSRPDIAGRTITMAGRDFEIVGVARAGFHGVELPNVVPTTIWIPLQAAALVQAGDPAARDREERWLLAKGRLAPGRTIEQAQAELRIIGRRLDETYPLGRDLPAIFRIPPYVSRPWVAIPAADRLINERADPSMLRIARLTMAAVILVLLVACTNLSNLTLARGVSRRQELAVRLALGASRWQIVREQMVESAIVAMLGAGAAIVAARALMIYGIGTTIQFGPWVSVDVTPNLDFAAAVVGTSATVLALILFGLVPAIQLTSGEVRLVGTGTSSTGHGGRWRGRRLLIASQVAVSVALVAIASLSARHVVAAASRETGVDLDRLALLRFDFSVQGWTEARARGALSRLADEAGRQTGTESVAVVSGLPVHGLGRTASFATLDRPFGPSTGRGRSLTLVAATPGVFTTLGVAVIAGRPFGARDTPAVDRVVVLSARAARTLFDTADAVGRTVLLRRPPAAGRAEGVDSLTVIGIASDTGGDGAGPLEGAAYVPFAQRYEPFATIAVRASRDATASVVALKNVAQRLEPELGIIDAGTGTELSGAENVGFEIMGALTGLLGLAAMVLAMAGLYGVLSYVVAQRTQEIGVRVALGATTKQIARLIVMDGVRPVIEGIVLGFVVADLAEMAMRPALQKPLPAIDATLMALVPLPFLVAAIVACYLPSRRAARVDPTVALRHS